MWGTRKLSSSGSLFLRAFKSGCRGTQAGRSRLITSAVYLPNQLSQTLQIKPWIFSEYRIMWFKSYRMNFACLNTVKSYRYPWTRPCSTSRTTVDSSEVKTFLTLAHKWWDEQGVYAPLHSMNDLRVPFISPDKGAATGIAQFNKYLLTNTYRELPLYGAWGEPLWKPLRHASFKHSRVLQELTVYHQRDNLLKTIANHRPGKPLSGMKILDVGCGGGLLTEPLGRLGASVIGIDPVDENIKTAQHHKSFDPVLDKRVEYRACSLEEIVEETAEMFDAVIASEVVEHVIDLETFIQCCCQVLKPGGSLFITTINKTQLSYALGIVFSEQIAGIVPKGTHTWEKFVSPENLESILESNGLSVQTVVGMIYNPFSGYWHWSGNTSLNYAAHAVKQEHPVPAGFVVKGETGEHQADASTSPAVHGELKK